MFILRKYKTFLPLQQTFKSFFPFTQKPYYPILTFMSQSPIHTNNNIDQEEEKNGGEIIPEIKDADNQALHEMLENKLTDTEIDPLRVCIQGLEPFSKEKDILKFVKNNFEPPLEVEAVTKSKGKNHAFIAFSTVEDKARFEKEGVGKKLKNKKIKIKPVKVNHQGLRFEKKVKTIENSGENRKLPEPTEDEIKAEMEKPIQSKVCPMLDTPYDEQIKFKREKFTNILKKIASNSYRQLQSEDKTLSNIPKWLKNEGNDPVCEINDAIQADEEFRLDYRNKAEFTVGESYEERGKSKVGFNQGNFNKGFMFVRDAGQCRMVSKEAIKIAQIFEDYIRASPHQYYDRIRHLGIWRNLVVRHSDSTKELLINVVLSKTNLNDDVAYDQIKKDLAELFVNKLASDNYKVASVLIQDNSNRSDNIPFDSPYDIIYGDKDYFMDDILGYKFRVNVNAFLQVNSGQCEKLYKLIEKLSNVDENTIFLDICSGIGTIGICMAGKAKKIIGVEIIDNAIEDSKYNAELNKLTNTEYICAKVENVIADVIKPYAGQAKIIGVVDPPRAGLHKDVVKALRTCRGLDRLIYVSCNPEGQSIDNLLGLCLPEGKRRRAPPFTITQAYMVDLFPQTEHFEAIYLLERLYGQ